MKLTLHVDGGARGNPGPGGCGVLIRDDAGAVILEAGYFLGRVTNNQAEYTGLIRALAEALPRHPDQIDVYSDSELLVRQINGDYKVRNEGLKPLYDEAVAALGKFARWHVHHVRREQNRDADRLANEAMDAAADVIHSSAD